MRAPPSPARPRRASAWRSAACCVRRPRCRCPHPPQRPPMTAAGRRRRRGRAGGWPPAGAGRARARAQPPHRQPPAASPPRPAAPAAPQRGRQARVWRRHTPAGQPWALAGNEPAAAGTAGRRRGAPARLRLPQRRARAARRPGAPPLPGPPHRRRRRPPPRGQPRCKTGRRKRQPGWAASARRREARQPFVGPQTHIAASVCLAPPQMAASTAACHAP